MTTPQKAKQSQKQTMSLSPRRELQMFLQTFTRNKAPPMLPESASRNRVPHHVKSEVFNPLTPQITYETLFERVSVSNDNFAKRYNHVQLERQNGMTDRFTNGTTGYGKLKGYYYFLFFSRETISESFTSDLDTCLLSPGS